MKISQFARILALLLAASVVSMVSCAKIVKELPGADTTYTDIESEPEYEYNTTWTYENGVLTITGTGSMDDYSYTSDRPWHAYEDNIKEVIITHGVERIGDYAFRDCDSLTSISIPDSVTSVGEYAFSNCVSLISISIPNSVTSIGYQAFSYCDRLTSVSIPDSVTSIGGCAFYNCYRLISINIPDSVTSIGEYAFSYCDSLTSVNIPDSVTSIGDGAFMGCTNLTSVTIASAEGDITIGEDAFPESCTVTYTG